MEDVKSYQELLKTLQAVQRELSAKTELLQDMAWQLEEATDTIEAIRSGKIDALVVKSEEGHQVYTLKSADQAYRIFIEQMTEGAVTLNPAGMIMYCNSQFGSMVGQSLEKVIGQPMSNFLDSASRTDFTDLLSGAWNGHVREELLLSRKVPVLLSLKALNLDEGLAMSIIITDLSQQKKVLQLLEQKNTELEYAKKVASYLNRTLEKTVEDRTHDLKKSIADKTLVEQALRANQERLTRILETMAEGVIILDMNGTLLYANPMSQKILGLYQKPEAQNSYINPRWPFYRVDGSLLPEHEHPMQLIMTGIPLIIDQEIGVQPPGKERLFISVNAAPIRDDDGTLVAGVLTFMDVTNRRKVIQQKDEFISVASHELKTPITSLKASLQILDRMKSNLDPSVVPPMIEQANKSLNRVSTLIDDLLNATKITEGQLQLNKKKINLAALTAECCAQAHVTGNTAIIIQGDKQLEVNADPDKIDQVITNLINNAVKYAPNSREIVVNIQSSGDMATVKITDEGPGISPDKLPHLFNRYFRVDNSGASYSGLGLGLYISAEIIKQHGGKIGAESEPGKGSVFWFSIPV